MILIIGGMGAGKRSFAKEILGYDPADIVWATLDERPVLAGLHELLRAAPLSPPLLEALLQKEALLCDEIGCGIVPMGKGERAWRDEVGRACAHLAREAETVVRICCGFPLLLKGSLEIDRPKNSTSI